METVVLLLKAMIGMGIVMGGWICVQSVARRHSGCSHSADHDTLEHMAHGCGNCIRGGASGGCRNRKLEKEHQS